MTQWNLQSDGCTGWPPTSTWLDESSNPLSWPPTSGDVLNADVGYPVTQRGIPEGVTCIGPGWVSGAATWYAQGTGTLATVTWASDPTGWGATFSGAYLVDTDTLNTNGQSVSIDADPLVLLTLAGAGWSISGVQGFSVAVTVSGTVAVGSGAEWALANASAVAETGVINVSDGAKFSAGASTTIAGTVTLSGTGSRLNLTGTTVGATAVITVNASGVLEMDAWTGVDADASVTIWGKVVYPATDLSDFNPKTTSALISAISAADVKVDIEIHPTVSGGAYVLGTFTHTADYVAIAGLPAVGNVLHDVDRGDGEIGTLQASSFANCEAGNVRKDVTIGDVTGTYDPMAAAVFPAEANTATTETAYGPTGVEYAGELDLTNLTAENVKSGVTIDGVLGTFAGSGGSGVMQLPIGLGFD